MKDPFCSALRKRWREQALTYEGRGLLIFSGDILPTAFMPVKKAKSFLKSLKLMDH